MAISGVGRSTVARKLTPEELAEMRASQARARAIDDAVRALKVDLPREIVELHRNATYANCVVAGSESVHVRTSPTVEGLMETERKLRDTPDHGTILQYLSKHIDSQWKQLKVWLHDGTTFIQEPETKRVEIVHASAVPIVHENAYLSAPAERVHDSTQWNFCLSTPTMSMEVNGQDGTIILQDLRPKLGYVSPFSPLESPLPQSLAQMSLHRYRVEDSTISSYPYDAYVVFPDASARGFEFLKHERVVASSILGKRDCIQIASVETRITDEGNLAVTHADGTSEIITPLAPLTWFLQARGTPGQSTRHSDEVILYSPPTQAAQAGTVQREAGRLSIGGLRVPVRN